MHQLPVPIPQHPTCCLFEVAGFMSPGFSPLSCFLCPRAVSVVEVHLCTQCSDRLRHRGPRADWKDTCLGTVRLSTLQREELPRTEKAAAPPLSLHALLLLNLPKGLPVPLLPARLWSAVLQRWEAARLPCHLSPLVSWGKDRKEKHLQVC